MLRDVIIMVTSIILNCIQFRKRLPEHRSGPSPRVASLRISHDAADSRLRRSIEVATNELRSYDGLHHTYCALSRTHAVSIDKSDHALCLVSVPAIPLTFYIPPLARRAPLLDTLSLSLHLQPYTMPIVTLGHYLWTRIRDVGINTVMGLPGDFQLNLLDSIYDIANLRFVGNGNELNAAYAADGYSRVKDVPGCIVTTHGVGELSALNGIAGAMTEQVKVIHIVGQTKRPMQRNREMIHHSIGFHPDHQVFNKASHSFRVAAAELQDINSAPHEIDRVIRACFMQSGPVYIFIPLDMVSEEVPAELLEKPIDLSLARDDLTKETMEAASAAILDTISKAKNPVVLVDGLVHRHNAINELRQLVAKLRFPVYCTQIGKGIVSETSDLNVGVYSGAVSGPGIADAFEANDLVLLFGHLPADTNTGNFSQKIVPEKTINFKPDQVDVSSGSVLKCSGS